MIKKTNDFKIIITAIFLLSLSFYEISKYLDSFKYNKEIVVFYNIIICLFILFIIFFASKFLIKKIENSKYKFLKSNFFKDFLIPILTFVFFIATFIIFFEIFYYIGYGKFDTEYLHNVFYLKVDHGKIFMDNFKETKGLFYSLLSVNALYVDVILSWFPFWLITLFINYCFKNNKNK